MNSNDDKIIDNILLQIDPYRQKCIKCFNIFIISKSQEFCKRYQIITKSENICFLCYFRYVQNEFFLYLKKHNTDVSELSSIYVDCQITYDGAKQRFVCIKNEVKE